MPTAARTLRTRGEEEASRTTGRRKRNSLSHDAIIAEAVAMLQNGALESLTLRGLAQRLGVAPMSLYTHFASRDDLIKAVAEHMFAFFDPPHSDETWQSYIRNWLWATYRLFKRYPAASKIIITDGSICSAWLKTWLPISARLEENGLHGYELAFAMDWFSTSAMAFIQSQMDAHTTRQPSALTFISELKLEDQRRAVELWGEFCQLDVEKALDFGFNQYVKGLEELVANAQATLSSHRN